VVWRGKVKRKQEYSFQPDLEKLGAELVRFDEAYPFQYAMRNRFVEEANDVLAKCTVKDPDERHIGFEMEFSVVHENLKPVVESIRNSCIDPEGYVDASGGRVTSEVGASQIEIVSKPEIVNGASGGLDILEHLKFTQNRLVKQLSDKKAFLLRIGAHPLVQIDEIKNTANVPKYVECPRFHRQNQRPGLDRYIGLNEAVNTTNPLIPGITNAVQLNVDCLNFDEAIDIFNRALMTAPVATVFGANAGFIQGIDTQYADLRYLAWGISHDIRSWGEFSRNKCLRVGMPDRYFADINDYLCHVLSTPFFMKSDNPFAMAIGTYWRDARLKFIEKGDGEVVLVVEFRPVATQPTLDEDFAIMMFYLGRVMYSCSVNEPMLPIEFLRANKEMAMRLGKGTKLYFCSNVTGEIEERSFKDYAQSELDFALDGLDKIGVDQATRAHVARHMDQRIQDANPIERFRETVFSGGIKNAIRSLDLLVGIDS
jgi:hypothetical protein